MIYQGDYTDNNIYGTSKNYRISVETENNAAFLACNLQVNFNGQFWEHDFEIPFFNNTAELYFENYIHSIITQNFQLNTLDKENIQFHHFNLAEVSMTLKEMEQNNVLDEIDYSFYMSLGSFNTIAYNDIVNGNKTLLPVKNSLFQTKKGLLSFSFISKTLPNKLIIDNSLELVELDITSTSTTLLIHSIVIPVKLIEGSETNNLNIALKFQDETMIALGDFNLLNRAVDHNTIAYQNEFGTLSILEFTGYRKDHEVIKTSINNLNAISSNVLFETEIEESNSFTINTGYIIDTLKYGMIRNLIRSYNKYLLEETNIKIVNNGNQKLKPYSSNYYENNESLKFKLAENANDIHYRIF